MRTRKEIVDADSQVRNEAILRMRNARDEALEEWYQKQLTGARLAFISLEIDNYFLRDELPDEIRQELEDAGFCVVTDGRQYRILL